MVSDDSEDPAQTETATLGTALSSTPDSPLGTPDSMSGTPDSLLDMPNSLLGTLPGGDPVAVLAREANKRAVFSRLFGREAAPTCLGHYVLLHVVGQGGMGVVHAAYDEQLDRKVALKLLRTPERADTRARLVREAQAMARLSHPNVVQIYEIGESRELVGGQPVAYLVMEFVDGQTLAHWLREQPRSRAAILDVFAQAGRGLAAAHAAGLVHRDFKPQNVMLRRDDGRALVMDFGLALGDAGPTMVDGESVELDSRELTATGTILGTPAYMAPEQFDGLTADAKTDQFSFCVALWEALLGQRPFFGNSLEELRAAICQPPRLPTQHEVPAWLRNVVARGFAADPGDRWPSMPALLDALAADPTYRRRWVVAGVASIGLAVAGWAIVSVVESRAETAQVAACEAEGQAIAELWNPSMQTRLAERFVAVELPYAAQAWERSAAALDDYAAKWTTLRTRTCVEARVEQRRDEASYARTAACFDEAKAAVAGLVEGWAQVDAATVVEATHAVMALPRLSQCTDDAWLARRIPAADDPATRARVAELRAELNRAQALSSAGQPKLALPIVEQVRSEADALGWSPLIAEADYGLGVVQTITGDFAESRVSLERAFYRAGRAGHDRIAANAAGELTGVVGLRLAEYQRGREWGALTQMLIDRDQLRRSPIHANLLEKLGNIAHAEGDQEQALASYQASLELREQLLGAEHSEVAIALNNIGVVHWEQGDYPKALAALERALAIHVLSLGSNHPEVAGTRMNIGLVLLEQQQLDRALVVMREAQADYRASLGPAHTETGLAGLNLALVHYEREELDDALREAEDARAVLRDALGSAHPYVAIANHVVGKIQRARGETELALELLEGALAGLEAALGPDHAYVKDALLDIGKAELDRGEPTRAREVLERARKIQLDAGTHPEDLEEIDRLLARARESASADE